MSGKASPEVLLATYLGRDVARRVLSGETSRGQGRLVRAGIFYADLKGFTALTDPMNKLDFRCGSISEVGNHIFDVR